MLVVVLGLGAWADKLTMDCIYACLMLFDYGTCTV